MWPGNEWKVKPGFRPSASNLGYDLANRRCTLSALAALAPGEPALWRAAREAEAALAALVDRGPFGPGIKEYKKGPFGPGIKKK